MGYPTKIATCCHCGSKAALKLDMGRHELACASCGAPLHNLKMLPRRVPEQPAVTHAPEPRGIKAMPMPARREMSFERSEKKFEKKKVKKSRKHKGWFGKRLRDMAEDVFDVVEDIFD